MSKIWVLVNFPIQIELEFDRSKSSDEDYIERKQKEAKDIAAAILNTSFIRPIIHDSELSDMIE